MAASLLDSAIINFLIGLVQQCSYTTYDNKSGNTKDNGFGHISTYIDAIAFMAYT